MAKNNKVKTNTSGDITVNNKSKKIALKIFLFLLMLILAIIVGIAGAIIKNKWIK